MTPGAGPLEEMLAHNRRLLAQVERLRTQVRALEGVARAADGIAHEFNNLVTVIVGYSDVMLRRLGQAHPLRTAVEGVREAAERGSRLVQALLDASRREEVGPRPVNVNDVVGRLLPALQRLVGDATEVRAVLEPALGRVRVEPRQLEQVLATVVVSTRDAMPRGGRVLIRTANVDGVEEGAGPWGPRRPAGRWVLLAIGDAEAGTDLLAVPGRDPADREGGPVGAVGAEGLGLSIAYDIVRRAGGDVRTPGASGRRAAFEIYLPRHDEPGLPAETVRGPLADGPATILLVEDEREVRELVRDVLELEGYRILVAEDGDAALTIDEGHAGRIDLLISDVVMPGLSGVVLADKLRASRPGLRTLLVSGYADQGADEPQCAGPGRAFLRKPFPIESLVEVVRRLLGEGLP